MTVSMAPEDISRRVNTVERQHSTGGSSRRPRPAVSKLSDEEIMEMAGVEKRFSTGEVAKMFGRSTQWVYWGLKEENGFPFRHPDGRPVDPERVGEGEHGRRRFTADECRAIARSTYHRGNISEERCKEILREILIRERGEESFAKPRRKKRNGTNS